MNLMFGLPETTGLDGAAGAAVDAAPACRRSRSGAGCAGRFGISAPRMAVRTRARRGRGARRSLLALVALIGGHVVVGLRLRPDLRRRSTARRSRRGWRRSRPRRRGSRSEARELRTRTSQLESDLAMSRGAQQALTQPDDRARRRERAAQGGARVPAEARVRLEQAGRARRSSGWPSSASATARIATACWWCAAASREDDFEGHVVLQASREPGRRHAPTDRRRCPTTSRTPRRRSSSGSSIISASRGVRVPAGRPPDGARPRGCSRTGARQCRARRGP